MTMLRPRDLERLNAEFLDYAFHVIRDQRPVPIGEFPILRDAFDTYSERLDSRLASLHFYDRFGLHEWEYELFEHLVQIGQVLAVAVLLPLAKNIAHDELARGYQRLRGRVIRLLRRLARNYRLEGRTDRGDLPRLDAMRGYFELCFEVLQRTGIDDFTTPEFARLAGVQEELAEAFLTFCSFSSADGRWSRPAGS